MLLFNLFGAENSRGWKILARNSQDNYSDPVFPQTYVETNQNPQYFKEKSQIFFRQNCSLHRCHLPIKLTKSIRRKLFQKGDIFSVNLLFTLNYSSLIFFDNEYTASKYRFHCVRWYVNRKQENQTYLQIFQYLLLLFLEQLASV